MSTFLQVIRFEGYSGAGEVETNVVLQLNKFLGEIDPVDVESINFTVENDEWGVGHSVVHVVYRKWFE